MEFEGKDSQEWFPLANDYYPERDMSGTIYDARNISNPSSVYGYILFSLETNKKQHSMPLK